MSLVPRRRRVIELFEAALGEEPQNRDEFLRRACQGDEALLEEVVSLVVEHERFEDSDQTTPATVAPRESGASQSAANTLKLLGRYEVIRELGRGAMGVVFEARDPLIGRRVAVKTIRLDSFGGGFEQKTLQDRLLHEARLAGNLSHPGIVTIHDVGVHGELAFIAMEYVDGPTLESFIASRSLDYRAATEILRQAAVALDYANQNGVVHRDVKPGNIMIHRGGTIKIADFGIAKVTTDEQMTRTGTVIGTPSYMSPEQIRGAPLDGRSDQFSLAVIAYEMLTHVKPFQADPLPALLHQIVYGDRPSARAAAPSLPPEVDDVLRRALAKNPEERYKTSTRFVEALREALQGNDLRVTAPPAQPPETRVPSFSRSTERSRLPFILAAIILIAAGAGVYFYNQRYASHSNPTAGTHSTPPELPPTDPIKTPPQTTPIPTGPEGAKPPPPPAALRADTMSELKYAWVPDGRATLGLSPGDHGTTDLPPHAFSTNGFWEGVTEVTVGAYRRFAAATKRAMPDPPRIAGRVMNENWAQADLPMVMVDWQDAHDFCAWDGGRLPTESEWEYAARGGTTGPAYDQPDEIAWYVNNSGPNPIDGTSLWEKQAKKVWVRYERMIVEQGAAIHPVARKKPNAFGLYDTLGSVLEWTADDYQPGQPRKAVRSDSAWGFIGPPRVSSRDGRAPLTRDGYLGFRCVIDQFVPPAESRRARTLSCSPTTLTSNGTLTLHFALPHPAELMIHAPNGRDYMLVYEPGVNAPPGQMPLIDKATFRNLEELKLDVATAAAFGSTSNEPIFQTAGTYEVVLADVLQSDVDQPVYRCQVALMAGGTSRAPSQDK